MPAYEITATGMELHDIDTVLDATDIDDAELKAQEAMETAHPELTDIIIESIREITPDGN